jgi:undecaprenyl-diphosphatase
VDISHLDRVILLAINGYARQSHLLDAIVVALSNSAFLQGGVFFIFLWGLWFAPAEDSRRERTDVLRIVAAMCVVILLARVLQVALPGRPRPIHDPRLTLVLPYGATAGVLEHWSSFPSDHAVVFFALATAIWRRARLLGFVAYLWAFFIACLPRIYMGYHYPSDVLAGAVIGVAVMAAAEALPLPAWGARLAEHAFRWERRRPALFYCAAVAVTFEFMSLFNDVRQLGRIAAQLVRLL